MAVLTKARDDVLQSLKTMKQEQQSTSQSLVESLQSEKQELEDKLKEYVSMYR